MSTRRRWIAMICALGGLRIFLFAAAYPFFSHIDEGLHYDVVLKYARGSLPTPANDRFEPQVGRMLALHASREYLAIPPYPPPVSRESQARAADAEIARVTAQRNVEASAPPLYYTLASAWYWLGRAIGLNGLPLLYWLRMLNVPIMVALIWLTWKFCGEFHPDRPEIALGAATIVAMLPQDVFYAINSDVLSPLVVVMAIHVTAKWWRDGGAALAVGAGLATAAALLTKYSNVPIVIVLLVAALRHLRSRPREPLLAMLCAALPVGAWMVRSRIVWGDFAAAHEKIRMMGWTPLPLSAAVHHPIFTVPGTLDFLWRLTVTFWRGELLWHASSQHLAWADTFYWIATAVALTAAAAALLIQPTNALRRERHIFMLHAIVVAGSVLFLAALSTRFDFGNCFYPSRGFPYFASGRLITGALAPFAILFVTGLDALSPQPHRRKIFYLLLSITLLVCIVSELYLSRGVFSNPFNLFHVRSS